MQLVEQLHIALVEGHHDVLGRQPQGAGVDAAAALDAVAGLGQLGPLLGEGQDGVVVLQDGLGQVRHAGAHHGAAQDDLGRFALVAAAEIDDVLQLGADGGKAAQLQRICT